ncbi:MAG: 30S ribosomal protein S7 [Candidatus Wildermuthbacteria bacterium]|nr:30S ribosomal protein S7 [Candidatus Wildermuthbacteria bacterium]
MSRRKKREKRIIPPDTIYNNITVSRFINQVMKGGKKTIAVKIVYGAFDIIKEKTNKPPVEIFEQAINNAKPLLEVRPKRVGGATYQVPRPVPQERALALAFRWILEAARVKKGKPMKERLAQELMDAANNTGTSLKKKENMHRMAEANRAFAHFAW